MECFIMKKLCVAAFAAAVLVAPVPASAQDLSLAVRAGTFGPSLGLAARVHDRVNMRIDVPYMTYTHSGVEQVDQFDLAFDTNIRLFTVSALADFHPLGNMLRLTGGAIYNGMEATFTARSANAHTVGAVTYSPEQIGELNGLIEMGSRVAPYIGIGLGSNVRRTGRLGFALDMGVMFNGPPRVTMWGSGMVEPTAEEAPVIEANLDWARYYPGITLGLTYRLF
jgi:hypothetical protein